MRTDVEHSDQTAGEGFAHTSFHRSCLIAAAISLACISYGELYPFDFHWQTDGAGPLHTFLASWNTPPGRGDLLANIVFYSPLGFFGSMVLRQRMGPVAVFVLMFLSMAGYSTSMELLQYFDQGRVPAVSDVLANLAGGAGGAIIALSVFPALYRQRLEAMVRPAPLLLLGIWAVDRLYPFLPVIDMHKYWRALKPIIYPTPTAPVEVVRHIAIWWTVALLVENSASTNRPAVRFALFAMAILIAKIFIIDSVLSKAELSGVVFAAAGALLLNYSKRLLPAFLMLFTYVLYERLEPLQLRPALAHFDWLPFHEFMQGSLSINTLSFLEKCFFYGALIWLLEELGVPRLRATTLVTALLVAMSVAEMFISQHSPKITDAAIALAIGLVLPAQQLRLELA